MRDVPVTYLFVPGDRPDRFAKAFASRADRVIIDLEDAVRAEEKPAARAAIRSASLDARRMVIRVNDAGSPFFADDLALLAAVKPGGVLLPKAEQPAALDAVAAAAGPRADLLPQVETVAGLESVTSLLAHHQASRAVFGHLDFALDLGAAPEWEPLLHARSRLVALSRLAGADAPVDSITTEIADAGATEQAAHSARALGFGGKLLIHPAQVEPAARGFRPADDEIAWARRVLAALATGGGGAVAVDGRMVDRPVEAAARRILHLSGGLKPGIGASAPAAET